VDFILEQIRVGGDRNFGYLVGDRAARVAAAIDPAFSPALFAERADAQGLRIAWILNTHGHGDHTNGNAELKRRTGARIAAHSGAPTPPDLALADGDEVAVGSVNIRALHVPGHTEDHLLFFLPAEKVAITGDLLFVGKVGGTATDEEARAEYDSLRRVQRELPPETTVWPRPGGAHEPLPAGEGPGLVPPAEARLAAVQAGARPEVGCGLPALGCGDAEGSVRPLQPAIYSLSSPLADNRKGEITWPRS